MIGDTGCCGFNIHEKGPTVFGLLTLSVPMMVLCIIALPFLFMVGLFSGPVRKIRDQVIVILRANLRLIRKKQFYPLFRCKLAGGLFALSPKLSGIVYKSFNLTLFIIIWIAVLCPIVLLVK